MKISLQPSPFALMHHSMTNVPLDELTIIRWSSTIKCRSKNDI